MPTEVPDLPDNLPDSHKTILKQWNRITELEVRAEQTVGGFLERNGKSIIAILLALATALGLTNLGANYLNHEKIDATANSVNATKQAVTEKVEEAASTNREAVQKVGEDVGEIKREVRKKKGPFGE